MKRLMLVGLLALGVAASARPARADCRFEWNVCRNICFEHTSKKRCFSYSSYNNPLSGHGGGGYAGPAMWDGYHPYAAPAYGAVPVAAAPAAAKPSFTAPQPTPARNSSVTPTGLQQAGYFYYAPATNAGYGYGAGYGYAAGYGYGYGVGSFQAPNYWYDN